MKFPNLFPRDDKFFRLLEKQAQEALACAQQLQLFMQGEDKALASAEIDRVRADAKASSSEIIAELYRSFMTPFDREDIQDFADHLYKVPKTIQHTKARILMHELADPDGAFLPQVELILREAVEMQKLVAALTGGKESKYVIAHVRRLHELEQEGDHVRNELIVSLYKSDRDIRELLLRRDICDMLEAVIDRFCDAAEVALQIVLKNS
jgi:uncharacterized protein